MTRNSTDIAIIGAGPVGLFMIFEAGMLKMKCHVVDTLEMIGGQCTALYPEKPIYDIPAHPKINGQELIDNLAEQAKSFDPVYHLGQQVLSCEKQGDLFILKTNKGTEIEAKSVVIAAGCGAFGPNKPPIEGIDDFENKSVFYMVKSKEEFRDKDIVIAGGGDSAVDWALSLQEITKSLKLVHRRPKFRCAPDSQEKLKQLESQGKIELVVPYQLDSVTGSNGMIDEVVVVDLDGNKKNLKADILLPFFGLSMELGPVANWGLGIDKSHIEVDPATGATNIPGIYAVGDISTYKNKLKLILSGFSECAMAAYSIYPIVHPNEALHFEYSTTKGVKN